MKLGFVLFLFFSSAFVPLWAQPASSATPKNKPKPIPFTLKAADEKTKAELPAKFNVRQVFAKKEFKTETPRANTNAIFILDNADTLYIETAVPGYYTIEEVLWVSCDTCNGYQHVALMEKKDSVFTDLKVNQAIRLDNIYFAQSSYELLRESHEQIAKLFRTLRTNPTLKIEIAGHTDNVGDPRLNQALSENRAKVIVSALVNMNIDEKRLKYRGYGHTRPAAPNDTEEHKQLNRRVEFVVLEFKP